MKTRSLYLSLAALAGLGTMITLGGCAGTVAFVPPAGYAPAPAPVVNGYGEYDPVYGWIWVGPIPAYGTPLWFTYYNGFRTHGWYDRGRGAFHDGHGGFRPGHPGGRR